jgi:hypothetical protein
MIEVVVRLYDSDLEPDPDRVSMIRASGFVEEFSLEAYTHKEALGLIMVSNPTWMLLVPEAARYLISHCPTDAWCIRVMRGDMEVRRFEMSFYPVPTRVVTEEHRVSRYARPPVI